MIGLRGLRFDVDECVPPVAELGRVHVLAVGGAGMSAVARLVKAAGLPVSGSDAKASALLTVLAAEGVPVVVGHDPEQVRDVDTVVFSSAIREDNPELARARRDGRRVLHRAQALTAVMQGRTVLAVAGANGKTTTTSMLVELLLGAGMDPGYAIGGELTGRGTNAALGGGSSFVVEADESDGSFLVYRPQVAVVTNVQADHLDFYGTFEAVRAAYRAFADTIAPQGLLVACADDPGSADLADYQRGRGGRVLTYGTDPGADVVIAEPVLQGLAAGAVLRAAGSAGSAGSADVALGLEVPGLHNLRNATGAYLAATAGLGVSPEAARAGLTGFSGVRRRFEARGHAGGVRVVDDYAHNPAKVAAVVSTAAGLIGDGRLVAVFQPHLYSRTRDFADAFGQALAAADVVVVLPVYAAREDPVPGVTGALVARAALAAGAPSVVDLSEAPSGEAGALAEIAERVAALTRPGDLVVTIGAGDVTEVGPLLLEALERPQRRG